MPRILKGIVLVLTFTIGFLGCSTTEEATKQTAEPSEESSGIYPNWYEQSGFSADSLSFHGFAMAVSSDSAIAMANAELQARVNLESQIAIKLESVREGLEDNGSEIATDPDFIITIRNAHNAVQDAADSGEQVALEEEDYYRGFAQVTILRSELIEVIKNGFNGKDSFWQEVSSSNLFQEEIQ